jgi:hypothetical protein
MVRRGPKKRQRFGNSKCWKRPESPEDRILDSLVPGAAREKGNNYPEGFIEGALAAFQAVKEDI